MIQTLVVKWNYLEEIYAEKDNLNIIVDIIQQSEVRKTKKPYLNVIKFFTGFMRS